jgi:hypothetical protein
VKAYSQTKRRYTKGRRGKTGLPLLSKVGHVGIFQRMENVTIRKSGLRIIKSSVHIERQNMEVTLENEVLDIIT